MHSTKKLYEGHQSDTDQYQLDFIEILHGVTDIFFGLELVTCNFALHKDFGLAITFCDHVTFCYCVFCSEQLSGGRELPHIAEF